MSCSGSVSSAAHDQGALGQGAAAPASIRMLPSSPGWIKSFQLQGACDIPAAFFTASINSDSHFRCQPIAPALKPHCTSDSPSFWTPYRPGHAPCKSTVKTVRTSGGGNPSWVLFVFCLLVCLFFNDFLGANNMTQWVTMIANKLDPLRLIPETTWWKRPNSCKWSLISIHMCGTGRTCVQVTYTHTNEWINKC